VDLVLALDRLDEPTLDWFHGQRRALAAAGVVDEMPATHDDTRAFLESRPEAVPSADGDGLPILHRWLGPSAGPLEETLIAVGAIRAVGVLR
jgi:hypothetical protein